MIINIMEGISRWAVPALVLGIPLWGLVRGVRVYEAFVEGAKHGLASAVRITPYLIAMFVAIRVFRAAGGMDLLLKAITPFTNMLGIPPEVVPMGIIRPLSGSGALGMLGELLHTYGPDSLVGMTASTIQGSTETTLYVLTVYFGAVGITRSRHALPIGLWSDLAGFLAAVLVCRRLF
ncbi:MAG: spore maturation protein [Firmicutes bacterium]|jgi:spore maturation protein B|nr:spore maturation protein [Bacillota bacterium]